MEGGPVNDRDNNDKVALITGGSSGIGEALAGLLLGHGYRVAVTSRDPSRLASVAERLTTDRDRLLPVRADPADWEDVSSAVERTVGAFGGIDVVVANAGFAVDGDVLAADPEGTRDMILVNILGPALLIKAAARHLAARKGRIALLGSVAGHKNVSGSVYSATKAAITALAENTRMRLASEGVGVMLVSPGAVLTEFWRNSRMPPPNALAADTIAQAIVWAIQQPAGMDLTSIVVRPRGEGL